MGAKRREVAVNTVSAVMSASLVVWMLVLAYQETSRGWRLAWLSSAALALLAMAVELRAIRRKLAAPGGESPRARPPG